jgi:hypothetical protein
MRDATAFAEPEAPTIDPAFDRADRVSSSSAVGRARLLKR